MLYRVDYDERADRFHVMHLQDLGVGEPNSWGCVATFASERVARRELEAMQRRQHLLLVAAGA